MDYGRILTRSFEITRRYRALWLFGILLALFGGQNSSNLNFGFDGGDLARGRTPGTFPLPSRIPWETIAGIIVVVACIVLILVVLSIIVRLVSRGALIGLVQELETNQAVPTVRRGFSIGFDRFWSLLGLALLVNIPLLLISLALLLVAVGPLIVSILPLIGAGRPPDEIMGLVVTGILSSVLLICCVGLFLLLLQLVITPLYQFFMREVVIAKRGAVDSIREGFRIVRDNVGSVALLYILLIGIAIAFTLLMIPVVLIMLGIVAAAAAAVGVATNSVTPGIVTAVILGIPVLLLLLFIGGLYQVFDSAVWTEGYLALTAPKPAEPAASAELAPGTG